MPNAKLQPVASPVDPFISAPGIAGPVQTQFDFQALRGLSQSLDSALNTAAEIERKRIERETLPANESLLEKLTKDQFRVLDAADPETSAGLKQLQSLGVKDADNPYAIAQLRKAAGVYQVQSAGYASFMRDTQWQEQAAQQVLYNHASPGDVVKARSDEFVKSLGGMTSEYAKVAAANYMAAENLKVVEEIGVAKDKKFQEDNARSALTALQPVVSSVIRQWEGNDSPEYRAATASAFQAYVAQQSKLLGSSEKAEVLVTQAIETAALQLARDEGEAANHLMDALEDAIGTPTMLPKLEDIRHKVSREIDSSTSQGELSKARASLASKLDDAFLQSGVKGAAATKDWFMGPEGQKIVNEVAKTFGIPDPSVLGDIRGDKITKWANFGNRTESDPETVAEAIKQAETSPESFATWLQAISPDKLVPEDRMRYSSYAAQNAQQDRFSPEVREARGKSFAASVIKFSPIADSEEAAPLLDELQRIHDEAYDESLGQDPGKKNTRSAGLKAKQAMYASEAWKNLTKIQEETSFAAYSQTPDYKSSVADYFTQMQTVALQDAADEAALSGGKGKVRSDILNNWSGVFKTGYNSFMREKYEQLASDPEIKAMSSANRKVEINQRMAAFAPIALQAAKGLAPAPKGSTVQTGQPLFNQAETLDRLGGVEEFPIGETMARAYVGSAFGNAYTAHLSRTQSSIDYFNKGQGAEFLDSLRGSSISNPGRLALAARLGPDKFAPRNLNEAGEVAAGVVALNIPNAAVAKQLYQAEIIKFGLTPKELARGIDNFGVPLSEIYGEPGGAPWYTNVPLRQIALYDSRDDLLKAVEDMKADPENSELAKVFRKLFLDPEKDADKFVQWQSPLISARTDEYGDYPTNNARYGHANEKGIYTRPGSTIPTGYIPNDLKARSEILRNARKMDTTIQPTDPTWLKTLKQRVIDLSGDQ